MRNLIYTGAAFVIVAAFISAAYAKDNIGNSDVSHLESGVAYPSSIGFQGATHEFKVHVQGQPLKELVIDLPEFLSISKGIEVKNQSGEKIDAQVSVNNRTATVVFSQPVEPQTTLLVELQGVNTSIRNHIWLYRVYGKMPNLTAQIPLGTVRIQTYGR
ncbi:DUF2808 domain-containing protein [Fischerella thermalis CCMEE 5273]|uniref:DUF2808 domain-containing protein n=1 Tax=Chlorogloeopsis fritschii PCC 6912 TaxID=211165 RepID=A0A3S0XYH9_CHLFR|nr:DUF2808 domain-containing protein [Chlorogloeopsis fritschii]PMB10720.1 DUF2808 domain-containing protein [Fischerella thermalis CCMEE 5273]PMB49444.1 DUF2808 domain-containing protein [Fischerella thermalis CCMEE 5205]RUR83869.1 hypothetical protein PCC6912_21120 [Chlorogloeopsis fritschii PCC 6912]